ncbi:uncharacterized protein LOC110425447 [Herrania umbratica]|uniref:Uncharacterized protein LOC110425447 n=1 Tax=Herrania umbratica TaxID=108875 RepID=A0A6J1BA45_9ROSI|nr:uncharacterized protein LOC110425447 [Herrania umbratica]
MISDEEQPWEVRISMPEIEHSDFIREKRAKLESALQEAREEESGTYQRAKPLIQRVPPALMSDVKKDFKKYFEPRQVAIGPLHHGNPKFEQAEHTKLKLAALFADKNKTRGEFLFIKIKEEIKDLRKCYNPEDIKDYDDDELAWMFFVDGCAVLYALYYVLGENQLPYRVLKILISLAKEPRKWEQLITEFIGYSLITDIRDGKSRHTDEEGKQEYTHLLEHLRKKLLTGCRAKSNSSMIGGLLLSCGDNQKHTKTFRSIKDLKGTGIHVTPSESNSLKNISFYCNLLGSLKMPRILVDDSTAAMFLNLVALEMCGNFENDLGVTTYLCFLSSLIDTAEDVKELRVTGVLHNYFGSDEEVANLFRRMGRDLVPDPLMYYDVIENIHRYCNSPVIWFYFNYSNYFGRNWSFLAFLGAIVGLGLTIIQTYFAVNPKK